MDNKQSKALKPQAQAGLPPHILAGMKEPTQYCDCKAKNVATKIGWFVQTTGGNYDINNAIFLCDACAEELAAIDPDVTIRPLQERKWEVLA